MIVITENRTIHVSSSYDKTETERYLVFSNEYGVTRLRVRKDKIVAFGNGLDNQHDEMEIIE